ncbi:MAG: ATP-binding protein [Clostridia bacterium]|nr:ATP-binding protein [Clostridia bacterium]
MERLKRKIDQYLIDWKNRSDKLPLIIKGARQIGKTNAIRNFGKNNYKVFIEINFAFQPEFKTIFKDGFDVNKVIKNITLKIPNIELIENDTLIFFDEMQECANTATVLKPFREDGRYDVICSGSLMGINYKEIESNSVGNKEDYIMRSMDFEEFLWAKGYKEDQIEDLYICMKETKPLSQVQYEVMMDNFKDYMIVGGMPAIVSKFVENNNFSGILKMQQQILIDYEEDITKYAGGLDKAKILNCYKKIPVFLGNENKKFQISKIADGARNREYVGVIEWLENAGIVNISYAMEQACLPLKANYNPDNYRLYFADTGLLIGSLDEEMQKDLRNNENMNTYKGALYENIVGDMLVKAGYDLFFYREDSKKIEMDFMIRDINSLIPVEVKANDNATVSLNNLINNDKYKDIKYGIKLCNKNIGFNGKFYTFPYFMTFLLKRYLSEKE